jgi:predicted RNase H-like nuclease (RuvC/YqgF family)
MIRKEIQTMRRLNLILAFVLVTALALTAAHIISAQQRGGMQQGQGRQQRQFDPEQMFERRLDRIKQNIKEMGLSAEEVDYLGTQIGNFLREGMNQRNAMQTLIEDLQKAMDAKNEAEMKTKLSEIKAKRKEHEKKLEEMEAKLIELLPVELEARLTIDGIINSGGGFGMMRIGGPRGQGGMPGAGGQRMQRGSGG